MPSTIEATREVVKKLSPIDKTLFGEMWEFTSDQARGDTAYTNIALGAHTDTSYFNTPEGRVVGLVWELLILFGVKMSLTANNNSTFLCIHDVV